MNQVNRHDPFEAQRVIERLLVNPALRTAGIALLTASWNYASSLFPERTFISLFPHLIRINVGNIEVAALKKNLVHLVIDKELVPKLKHEKSAYITVPNSFCLDFSEINAEDLRESYAWYLELHLSLINHAGKSKKHPMTEKAHSPGVVAFIENVATSSSSFITPRERSTEELPPLDGFFEGATDTVLVNRYERSREARAACIAIHGAACMVCGFNFGEVYGHIGTGFIHIHHLHPLSLKDEGYLVNPTTDLVPVCANCHAMLHRKSPTPYTPAELSDLLRNRSS